MALPPPQYEDSLGVFCGDLRSLLFNSQREAAGYFGVARPTINRYEAGRYPAPVAYIAALIYLVVEAQEEADREEYRKRLLQGVNQAIRDYHTDEIFQDWLDLETVAKDRLAQVDKTNKSDDRAQTNIPHEAGPLPTVYVERKRLQDLLVQKIIEEKTSALVLWGAGGMGKSMIAQWLINQGHSEFPDGQLWVEVPETGTPATAIQEVQASVARRFGVTLYGTALAERAAQLRTLLAEKRCLIILDNLWFTSQLSHLKIISEGSHLLITTRYQKVADVLETPVIPVKGMSLAEGEALLANWAEQPIEGSKLVDRLGGLPLALKLSGVQLREGETVEALLGYFRQNQVDLSQLALDNPESTSDSLIPCFDQSFIRLNEAEQKRFRQLGCFIARFDQLACQNLWGLPTPEVKRLLRRFCALALVERFKTHYRLHPLIRDYAQQKLQTDQTDYATAQRRLAAYHIRYYLYHPQVLDDVTTQAPSVEDIWPDIVAGVNWATQHTPQLAAMATLLAHTERPALLEAVGPSLIDSIELYLTNDLDNTSEQALIHDLLGDLYILNGDLSKALNHFEKSAALWTVIDQPFISHRAILRMAGLSLIISDLNATGNKLAQAQKNLSECLPISPDHLEVARWLFYWFDLIYTIFIRSNSIELLADLVIDFVNLAKETEQPLLEARGLHIYRLYLTANHPLKDHPKGRQAAATAAWLWWKYGEKDKALAEVMWAQEATSPRKNVYNLRRKKFARRLSHATPTLSQDQIEIIEQDQMRSWLMMREDDRITWFVEELMPPGTDNWEAVKDILSISTMGKPIRRLAQGLTRPDDSMISESIWKLLTGQRALPLVGHSVQNVVQRYLNLLEATLRDDYYG